MKRNNTWRWLLTIFIVAWALNELYPPAGRSLLEVFQEKASKTDTNFTAIVERTKKLQEKTPTRSFGNLREAIGTNDLRNYFPQYNVSAEINPTAAILNRLQREAAGKIKLGLDLQGGTSLLVSMDMSKFTNAASTDFIIEQAIEVLRKRVDKFGVAEPVIQQAGNNLILIQMPGLTEEDRKSVRENVQKAAFLEFRTVHADSSALLEQNMIVPGYEKLMMRVRSSARQPSQPQSESLIPYLVKRASEGGLGGRHVTRAGVYNDPMNGQPQIHFELNDEGAQLFAKITTENVGRQLAIVLDGELISAPNINEPIPGGRVQITGSFTPKEAFELATALENPLAAPLKVQEERSVDPTLGKDAIESGITASAIAAISTFIFMLVFYFASGLIANFALALNVLILMGVMASMGATLTMPGIAGIALTIGMAVDANVLIYERMREEIAAGKSIRGIVTAGYDKAFGTIFDSNLTTLIAAVILIYYGTGPVKGFGVTLTVGIAVSMFTALFVTRLVYDFLLGRGWLSRVRMLPLAKFERIPFMKWGKLACILSTVLILIGLGSGLVRGKKVLGVDFAGGDALTLTFTERVAEDQLRKALDGGALGDSSIGYQKSLATGREMLQIVVPLGAAEKAKTILKESFPKSGLDVVGADQVVGATVGREIQRSAIVAALLAMFFILVYVAFRYEFSFAVAAVIALLHDVLITLGIYFLSGRQLTAPMIAGILTIIGYSINDKIVIMDRIREDLKLGVRGSFHQLIDIALNQTLSRTIITGGAVILATLSLFFFGGGVINDFAFAFLVGTISGTYSSLLIASPIVLWWHKGERPNIGSGSVPAVEAEVAARV
jgi:SecD/SecF fusion protein